MNDLKTGQGFFTVKMDRLKEITGYSLIELLIVMVLISVTALLTFSGTKSPESKIKKTAFGLKADMELAKMEAVKRNQNVLVKFSGNYTYCIQVQGEGNCTKTVTIDPEYSDNSSRVSLGSRTYNTIVFTPRGTSSPGRTTLKYKYENSTYSIDAKTNNTARISLGAITVE